MLVGSAGDGAAVTQDSFGRKSSSMRNTQDIKNGEA